MPYYNKKEYPKQIWMSQIPEREVSLLRENLAGIKQTTFVLMKREEAFHQLTGKRSRDIIFLSSDQSLLDLARDVDVPAIAYQKPEVDTFLHADMVVEGFEEVDMTFLQRVYERHFNIPWTILETKRCIVRELELSDLDELFAMYAEPGMTDYMEGLFEYEEELQYQRDYIKYMYGFYGYGMWLVFEKKTGTLIGRAGLEHREKLNGEMELGYAIRTSFQHQGYAYEVCQAIVEYAKEELQASLLHCLIEKGNNISEKLAQKLGFSYCGDRILDNTLMSDYQQKW